jgi:membrane-associated phospholipid phosphatase
VSALSIHRDSDVWPWRRVLLEIALWSGFAVAYEITRGLVAGSRARAFVNGGDVIRLERGLGSLFELNVQRVVLQAPHVLLVVVDWSYWLSQLIVVLLVVAWVYVRRNEMYVRLRNTLVLANTLALVAYAAVPLAPPRLFPQVGFVDTLASSGTLTHGDGLVRLFANPYAAMPSVHAADALIVGIALAYASRRTWIRTLCLLWPTWVAFVVIATGNHYWLDVATGFALALLAGSVTLRPPGLDQRRVVERGFLEAGDARGRCRSYCRWRYLGIDRRSRPRNPPGGR